MRLRLTRGWHKATLLLVLVAGGAMYVTYCARSWMAARDSGRNERAALERATELEPLNATHFYRLGRYQFANEGEPIDALPALRRAVALDPHTSLYWLQLAQAYHAAGNSLAMRDAVERALTTDPRTPENLWRAANLLLLAGDTQRSFDVLRELIGPNPEYAPDAISLAWRATGDADAVLAHVVPPQPKPLLTLLRMTLRQDQPQAAAHTWNALVAAGQPFDASQAFPYIDYLLRRNEGAAARKAWSQLGPLDADLAPYVASDLIVNSRFELPVLDGGLDWRHQSRSGVSLEVTTEDAHSGAHALSIAFEGAPPDAGIEQWVTVEPNALYELRAFFKSSVEGSGLPRLGVFNLKGERLSLSDEMRPTPQWQESRLVFQTAPDQTVAIVRLTRGSAGARLHGQMLLDDVAMIREK